MSRPGVGFFSSFNQVLGELHGCLRTGEVPIVFFGSNSPYWSAEGYGGARNAWEYYFEPLSPRRAADVLGLDQAAFERCNPFDFEPGRMRAHLPPEAYDLSRRGQLPVPDGVTVAADWPSLNPGLRRFNEVHRLELHEVAQRFIRVRPEVAATADALFDRLLAGRPCVGVHVRGPEHDDEVRDCHGLARASSEDYFREVDAYLARQPGARVFLATDRYVTRDEFKARYGSRLVHAPSHLAGPTGSPHYELGGPEVGAEILVEALLLARSDFLVHGISNVAFAVLCLNAALPHADVYERNEFRLTQSLRWRRFRAAPVSYPWGVLGRLAAKVRRRLGLAGRAPGR